MYKFYFITYLKIEFLLDKIFMCLAREYLLHLLAGCVCCHAEYC